MHMNKSSGMTLYELLVVLAIGAVLLSLAAPSFTKLVKSNRLTTQVNEFVASVNFARNVAIKRGGRVSLCRSDDGATCATAGGWEQGWIIFRDVDEDGDYDASGSTPDTLIRVMNGLKGDITLIPDGSFTSNISVTYQGFSTKAGDFVMCYDSDGDGDTNDAADFNIGKSVSISLTGRVSTGKASDTTFSNCVTP